MGRNKLIILIIIMAFIPQVVKATSPTGVTTISLTPSEKTIGINESFTAQININTKNSSILGLRFILNYPFTGPSPALEIQDINLTDEFDATGYWTLTKEIITSGNTTKATVAIFVTRPGGYTSAGQEVALVNIILKGTKLGTSTISFDPVQTAMWENLPGGVVIDILQTPTSTVIYTVGSPPTITPIPTLSPTLTPTPCPITEQGDFNCDGKINEIDLTLLLNTWGAPSLPNLDVLFRNWKTE